MILLKIELEMIVDGTDITFDPSGSAPECRGPFTSPISNTVAGLMIAMRHVFRDVPVNSGCFAPCKRIIPEGPMPDPRPPRAVSGTMTDDKMALRGLLEKASEPFPAPGQAPAPDVEMMMLA